MTTGKRFSQIYLEHGAPTPDSTRFRNRLQAFYRKDLYNSYSSTIPITIRLELGITVTTNAGGYYDLVNFFGKEQIRDVLDSITVIYDLVKKRNAQAAEEWRLFVERTLKEENLGYRIDNNAIIHYLIDEEFERSRISVLAALENQRYAGIKAAFEDAHRYLDTDPIDTKASVRSVFESIEILVKLMAPSVHRLTKKVVQTELKEIVTTTYKDDSVAIETIDKIFDGLGEWFDALHNYRHGQGKEEPVVPPLDFAVYIFSSGASFLRWLIEIDQKITNI
jgi:hypothetical protein